MSRALWVLVSWVAIAGAGALGRAEFRQQDVDGRLHDLFQPADKANVLLFVSSDCPVSNGYAPEIQRICAAARARDVMCALVYEDASIDAAAVRAHREQYRYGGMAAVIDRDRSLAERVKATVTPEAVVIARGGAVKYRGRIDNQYAALGKPRQVVTVHDLRDAIDAVVKGQAVAHPDTEAFGCFIPRRNPS